MKKDYGVFIIGSLVFSIIRITMAIFILITVAFPTIFQRIWLSTDTQQVNPTVCPSRHSARFMITGTKTTSLKTPLLSTKLLRVNILTKSAQFSFQTHSPRMTAATSSTISIPIWVRATWLATLSKLISASFMIRVFPLNLRTRLLLFQPVFMITARALTQGLLLWADFFTRAKAKK